MGRSSPKVCNDRQLRIHFITVAFDYNGKLVLEDVGGTSCTQNIWMLLLHKQHYAQVLCIIENNKASK